MDDNERIDRGVDAPRGRMDILEAEATGARPPAPHDTLAPVIGNRRQVLLGGAGLLGVLAGGALLGRAEPASAAVTGTEPASAVIESGLAEALPDKHLGLRATLTPLKTRGVLWVNHEWEFGAHFVGEQPPVVVATAFDDYMEHDVAACCVCAVAVHGEPGAYRATIMVRNISTFATAVVINAVAVGM